MKSSKKKEKSSKWSELVATESRFRAVITDPSGTIARNNAPTRRRVAMGLTKLQVPSSNQMLLKVERIRQMRALSTRSARDLDVTRAKVLKAVEIAHTLGLVALERVLKVKLTNRTTKEAVVAVVASRLLPKTVKEINKSN